MLLIRFSYSGNIPFESNNVKGFFCSKYDYSIEDFLGLLKIKKIDAKVVFQKQPLLHQFLELIS